MVNPEAAEPEQVRVRSGVTTEFISCKGGNTMPATATVTPGSVQEKSLPKSRVSADNQAMESALEQDIAKLAYALWQQRGCPEGSPQIDWFAAEESLRAS